MITNTTNTVHEKSHISQKFATSRKVCRTASLITGGATIALEFLVGDRCVSFSILYCLLIFASMLSVCGYAHMSGTKRAVGVTVTSAMALIFAALSFISTFFSYMDLSPDNVNSVASGMVVSALFLHGIALAAALLVSRLLIRRKKI